MKLSSSTYTIHKWGGFIDGGANYLEADGWTDELGQLHFRLSAAEGSVYPDLHGIIDAKEAAALRDLLTAYLETK